MPISSIAAALQPKPPDIEKVALYPRQAKVDDGPKKKKTGPTLGLFDLLKADANSGESKLTTSGAFAAALQSPTKPAANMGDMLAYWQNVTKASKAEQERLSARLNTVLKSVKMEGFKQASSAKTWKAKIFWLIMLVMIVGILSFEIWKCVKDYNNSPVTTKFTISTPPSMDFPKVYICYGNAFNYTYATMHKDMMQVALAFRNRDAITKKSRRKRQLEMEDERVMDILKMSADRSMDEELMDDDGFDGLGMRLRRDVVVAAANRTADANATLLAQAAATKAAQARLEAILQYPNISDMIYQYYQEAGYKVEDSFLECSFDGYKKEILNCKDIVRPVVDSNYALCYVIDLPSSMKQTLAGKGLNVILNSHTDLYPKKFQEAPPRYAGLMVSVDKDYNPFNWEKTCVTEGRVTKIDLSMTHVHLENLESGPLIQHCLNNDQTDGLFQIFKANYTRTTCQMDCLFQSHKNNCDCLILVDRSQLRDDVLKSTGFCSSKQFAECVAVLPNNDAVQKQVNACLANCYSPCESYRYDMRASYAKLHYPSYARFQLPPNVTTKQLVDLRVAFSRLEYAELIQKPSASFADLVANLGGQINLWMGASLISLFEMVFMGVGLLVWSCYMKCVKKRLPEKKGPVNGGGQGKKV